jgi:ferredoxin
MPGAPGSHVDPDLCTECSDRIEAMPAAFRKVEDEAFAEVHDADLDESRLSELQKMMTECPSHAIRWRK